MPSHTVHIDAFEEERKRNVELNRQRSLGHLRRDIMRRPKEPSATIQFAASLRPETTTDPTPTLSAEGKVRQLMGHLSNDLNTEQVGFATKPVSVDPLPSVSLQETAPGLMTQPISMLSDPVVTTEGAGAEILPATVQPQPDTIVVPTNTGPRVEVVPGDLSDPLRQPPVIETPIAQEVPSEPVASTFPPTQQLPTVVQHTPVEVPQIPTKADQPDIPPRRPLQPSEAKASYGQPTIQPTHIPSPRRRIPHQPKIRVDEPSPKRPIVVGRRKTVRLPEPPRFTRIPGAHVRKPIPGGRQSQINWGDSPVHLYSPPTVRPHPNPQFQRHITQDEIGSVVPPPRAKTPPRVKRQRQQIVIDSPVRPPQPHDRPRQQVVIDSPVRPPHNRPQERRGPRRRMGIDPPDGGDESPPGGDSGTRRSPSPGRRRKPRPRRGGGGGDRGGGGRGGGGGGRDGRDGRDARPAAPGRPGAPGPAGAAGGGGGGSGGGSAASAAAAAGGAATGAAQRAAELAIIAAKKKKRRASGITKAKKRYTDQRKLKMASLRSLKAKRIREFATKTKKLKKKQRNQARKEFKAKADARYKEMAGKFPPARGLRDLATVLQLIKKLEAVRMAQ